MPTNHGLRTNDDEVVSPLRPEPRKGDPEGSVQWAQSRSRPILGVDRKLLAEGKLNDRLFLATPE